MLNCYDIRQEADGTWTVFDQEDGFPVMLGGILLIGLDVDDAMKALAWLSNEAEADADQTRH